MTNTDLAALRASLLRTLGDPLGPEDGDAAFDRHILLAVRIHRAAGLNASASDREGQMWSRYFVEHFPAPRSRREDAAFLWSKWRTEMLKRESPSAITHGQPHAHWHPLPEGGFCVNLESMWDDFGRSVDHFIATLEADLERREVALRRWRERAWTIRWIPLAPSEHLYPSPTLYPGATAMTGNAAPSFAASAGRSVSITPKPIGDK